MQAEIWYCSAIIICRPLRRFAVLFKGIQPDDFRSKIRSNLPLHLGGPERKNVSDAWQFEFIDYQIFPEGPLLANARSACLGMSATTRESSNYCR